MMCRFVIKQCFLQIINKRLLGFAGRFESPFPFWIWIAKKNKVLVSYSEFPKLEFYCSASLLDKLSAHLINHAPKGFRITNNSAPATVS